MVVRAEDLTTSSGDRASSSLPSKTHREGVEGNRNNKIVDAFFRSGHRLPPRLLVLSSPSRSYYFAFPTPSPSYSLRCLVRNSRRIEQDEPRCRSRCNPSQVASTSLNLGSAAAVMCRSAFLVVELNASTRLGREV